MFKTKVIRKRKIKTIYIMPHLSQDLRWLTLGML